MTNHYEVIRTFIKEIGQEKGTVSGQMAMDSLFELEKELKVSDDLLKDRDAFLKAIPACPVHGECVPHALEWIERVKTLSKIIAVANANDWVLARKVHTMRDDGLTPDVIAKLEEKLTQQGRTLECVDPRNRPGHPPDWVISFADGSKHYVCGYDRESLLPLATMLLEPIPTPDANENHQ